MQPQNYLRVRDGFCFDYIWITLILEQLSNHFLCGVAGVLKLQFRVIICIILFSSILYFYFIHLHVKQQGREHEIAQLVAILIAQSTLPNTFSHTRNMPAMNFGFSSKADSSSRTSKEITAMKQFDSTNTFVCWLVIKMMF